LLDISRSFVFNFCFFIATIGGTTVFGSFFSILFFSFFFFSLYCFVSQYGQTLASDTIFFLQFLFIHLFFLLQKINHKIQNNNISHINIKNSAIKKYGFIAR